MVEYDVGGQMRYPSGNFPVTVKRGDERLFLGTWDVMSGVRGR